MKNRNQGAFEVFSYINRNLDEETMDAEFKDLIKEKEKGSKMAVMEILQWKYICRYQNSEIIISEQSERAQSCSCSIEISDRYVFISESAVALSI